MRRREFMKKFVAIPLVAVMLTALAVPVLVGRGKYRKTNDYNRTHSN